MSAELNELGLDPAALPALNKLAPEQLRKVMKTFTKALGVQCNGCHDTSNFRAPTRNKTITTHMWNDFSRGLVLADDGRPAYCDSCHGGRRSFLDRKDPHAVAAWMDDGVARLKRVDGKEHSCETCHSDPVEPKIFSKVWK
jgi:hypothetical protein